MDLVSCVPAQVADAREPGEVATLILASVTIGGSPLPLPLSPKSLHATHPSELVLKVPVLKGGFCAPFCAKDATVSDDVAVDPAGKLYATQVRYEQRVAS